MNPVFVCSVCLPLWLAKQINKPFQLCVLLGELLNSDASWWWQRRTELILFQQLDVSFCFCSFEVEPCVGLFFFLFCLFFKIPLPLNFWPLPPHYHHSRCPSVSNPACTKRLIIIIHSFHMTSELLGHTLLEGKTVLQSFALQPSIKRLRI